MEQIEFFFDFLKTHLKEEFKYKKFTYTIEYYEYYHNHGDFESRSNNFRIPKPDGFEITEGDEKGFYLVLEIFGSGDYFGVYLNPSLQEILKKRKYDDKGQPVVETDSSSLFNELDKLYSERCKEFYMDLTKYMQYISTDDYSLKIKNILIRLKDFENQAKSPEYYVVSRDYGSDYSLLYKYLKDLIKKVIETFSSKIDLDNSVLQVDNEESINLESKNLFNSGSIKDVKEFFENFTLLKLSDDSEPVLTRKQVNVFIKRVFIKDSAYTDNNVKLKMHFNPKRQNTKLIEYIFYRFYLKSKNAFGEKFRASKEKYVKLLTDNFEGFDKELAENNFALKPEIPKELEDIISKFQTDENKERTA